MCKLLTLLYLGREDYDTHTNEPKLTPAQVRDMHESMVASNSNREASTGKLQSKAKTAAPVARAVARIDAAEIDIESDWATLSD